MRPTCNIIFLLLFIIGACDSENPAFCDTAIRPFEIVPENAKFIIGGSFPLYENDASYDDNNVEAQKKDCSRVKPEAVQELIAVQWALSFWNQNEKNAKMKLALSVYGTCSKENEGFNGATEFLREYKFFSVKECRQFQYNQNRQNGSENPPMPLGLILSKSSRVSAITKNLVQATLRLPLVTQSPLTHYIIKGDSKEANLFLTTASLTQYTKLASKIFKETQNNLVTVVYNSDQLSKDHLRPIISLITDANVKIFEEAQLSDLLDPQNDWSNGSASNISQIFLTYLDKPGFTRLVEKGSRTVTNGRRLYVYIPILGESLSENEAMGLARKAGDGQLLVLHTAPVSTPDFMHYFLDIVKNNHQLYAFMARYLQQQYNCTTTETIGSTNRNRRCSDLNYGELANGFTQVADVQSAVLMIYTFAAIAKTPLGNDHNADLNIDDSFAGKLKHELSDLDPPALLKFKNISFDDKGAIKDIAVQASYFYQTRNNGPYEIERKLVAEYLPGRSNENPTVHIKRFIWSDNTPLISVCTYNLPQCLACNRIEHLNDGKGISLDRSTNLYLLGLFDIRPWNADQGECGPANDPGTIVAPLSFFYVLETMKQKYPELNLLNGVDIGRLMFDGCQSTLKTVRMISSSSSDCLMVNARRDRKNVTISSQNVVGLVSGQNDNIYAVTRYLLASGDSPARLLLSATASGPPGVHSYSELNVMPDYESYGRALVDILVKNRWTYVSVILSMYDSDSTQMFDSFRPLAESVQICIGEVFRITRDDQSSYNAMKLNTKIVLMFTTAEDAAKLMKRPHNFTTGSGGNQDEKPKPVFYLLVNSAHDFHLYRRNASIAPNSEVIVSVQPALTPDSAFLKFLESVNPETLPEQWFVSFWEEYFQCSINNNLENATDIHRVQGHSKRTCSRIEKLPPHQAYGRLTRIAYLMNSLETLLFILDGVYKRMCPEQTGLCDEFFEQYRAMMFELIEKVPKILKFSIYVYKIDSDDIYESKSSYQQVGNWTVQTGLVYSENITWHTKHGNMDKSGIAPSNETLPESICTLPACRCKLDADFFAKPIVDDALVIEENNRETVQLLKKTQELENQQQNNWRFVPGAQQDLLNLPVKKDVWKTQTWTYVFLVLTTLLLICATAILGLVVVKLFCRVIKGNQSLGICLIFGVIMLFVTCYFFIFDPDPVMCRLRYFSHSLSYCLCFGVMIAKACQLRNSETVGLNGYVSFWNYWLLLFFIVAVQLALNLQWIIGRTPVVTNVVQREQMVYIRCNWDQGEFLVSHAYVIILLTMATFLAFVSRNVKRNYKETRWLLYTCLVCAPVWLVWTGFYAVAPVNMRDTIVVMELIACATVILCFMFGPKVYILLSYEPVLVEYQPSCKFSQNNPTIAAGISKTYASSFDESSIYFDTDNFAVLPACRNSPISNVGSLPRPSGTTNGDSSTVTALPPDEEGSIYQTAIRKKRSSKKNSTKDLSRSSQSKQNARKGVEESCDGEDNVMRDNPIFNDPVN